MIKIYNSFSKKTEGFIPLKENEVSIYLCGVTVYNIPHIGNARGAICFDIIRRYFEYLGFKVKFVSNYTDIDDKMINKAKELGISVKQLADTIIPIAQKYYEMLNIENPDFRPKATEYIKEIIELISKLNEKGYTYVLSDGVYFDVSKFKDYGKLSGQLLDELQSGARVDVNDEKKSPLDFVLWKLKKEGEPFWESPWGEGRPGWHIECSAMSSAILGETFDIHCGGLDLKFPHHECEIAQSQAVYGSNSFARFWLHNGFLNMNNEKMSKSIGNIVNLEDIMEKIDPLLIRFVFIQTHYRNPLNFSYELIEQAKPALEKIRNFVNNLNNISVYSSDNILVEKFIQKAKKHFEDSMNNDFDVSGAFAALFNFISDINPLLSGNLISKSDVLKVLDFLKDLDKVFAVIFVQNKYDFSSEEKELIEKYKTEKINKNFAVSDNLRKELLEKYKIKIEDHKDGIRFMKVL